MRGLWKRWVALVVFMAVLGVVMINLGEWQLRRLDERRHRNATVVANQALPPASFAEVFGGPISDDQQWRRVTVTGAYDAQNQYQVRYRYNNGVQGYEVVTPLRTADGRAVLVDRGFVVVPSGSRIPDVLPAAPSGQVTVTGHVRRSEHGKRGAIDPNNFQVRLVNAPAIGRTLPYPVVDGYVSLTESSVPQEGGFEPLALPKLDEGPHFSYAMQWFLFTIVGIVGVIFFIRADIRERRKERVLRAARDAAEAVEPAKAVEPSEAAGAGTAGADDADVPVETDRDR
ncbi:SURF1 family protein [Mariniluteicoccus endophyticus]